jgi:hypothetical protein
MKTENLNLYIFTGGFPYYPYRSRTGIVLDDTEYKPMGVMNRPIITAPSPVAGHVGDIFDVTVTAIQGPGGANTGQPFIYPGECVILSTRYKVTRQRTDCLIILVLTQLNPLQSIP